jgi:hypothetical protein
MLDLSGNILSMTWIKVQDVAYEDVHKEFEFIWCVKILIVARSSLEVTWKVRPQMSIIS